MISIGQRIKTLRIERKMQQKDLSNAMGFSISALQNYENDVRPPSLEKQLALAKFFDVSLEYLRGESDFREHGFNFHEPAPPYNAGYNGYEIHAHRDPSVEGMPLEEALGLVEQLSKLARLHDEGKLTDEEFAKMKKKIIG